MHAFAILRRLLPAMLAMHVGMAAAVAEDSVRPVRIRVQWGGGTPRGWSGQIITTDRGGQSAAAGPQQLVWQTLCREPDAAAHAHSTADGIAVHQLRPVAIDGVELTIHDWPRARLRVQLGPTTTGDPGL